MRIFRHIFDSNRIDFTVIILIHRQRDIPMTQVKLTSRGKSFVFEGLTLRLRYGRGQANRQGGDRKKLPIN
jgi:hypothetical protein